MLVKNGREYYPLDFGHMEKGGRVYYDRSARRANYFYLDFRSPRAGNMFIPVGADALLTADGMTFCVQS